MMRTKNRTTILALAAVVVVFGTAPNKPVCGSCTSVGIIEEQDGTGSVVREIVHAAGRPAWQILVGGSAQYFHEDPRGNIVMLTDAAGACAVRYTYDPYGRPVAQDCANADLIDATSGSYEESKQFANPLLFRGSWYDPETGERGATPETDFTGLYAGPGGPYYHADEGRSTTRGSDHDAAPPRYALPSSGTVNATAGILQADGQGSSGGNWYEGWIEVNSVTQTVTRAIETGRSGTARARAGTVLEEIEVEKELDRTSVPLVQASSSGSPSVTQTVTRAIETGRSGTARSGIETGRSGTARSHIETGRSGTARSHIETGRSGTARARAGTVLEEIEVEKEVDRTSVPLVQATSGGSRYPGWIELNSVSQTVTRAIETGRSGTARSGAPGMGSVSFAATVTRAIETGRSGTARARAGCVLEEIEVEKEVDRTSIPLVQATSGRTWYPGWIELNSVTQTVTRAIETGRSGTARARAGTVIEETYVGVGPLGMSLGLGRCVYPFCPGYLPNGAP